MDQEECQALPSSWEMDRNMQWCPTLWFPSVWSPLPVMQVFEEIVSVLLDLSSQVWKTENFLWEKCALIMRG